MSRFYTSCYSFILFAMIHPPVLFVIFEATRVEDDARIDRLVDLASDLRNKITRVEIIYFPGAHLPAGAFAERVRGKKEGPIVRARLVSVEDTKDSGALLAALSEQFRAYPFLPEEEDYYVLLPPGAPILQAVLLRLISSRHLPAKAASVAERPDGPDGRIVELRVLEMSRESDPRVTNSRIREKDEAISFLLGGVSTHSAAYEKVILGVERAALGTGQAILLRGEPGTGRARLARRLFELRRVRLHLRGPFVATSGWNLRGASGMATLVGHGSEGSPPGLLASADSGVLFISDIDRADMEHQAVLLRVLENRLYLPLASGSEKTSSFLLIATSCEDLDTLVGTEQLRADFLAKLKTWSFNLPPLRERLEDLETAFDFILLRVSRRSGRRVRLSSEARESYLAFCRSRKARWTNNFRDLVASAHRLASLPYDEIPLEDVVEEIETLRRTWAADLSPLGHDPLLAFLHPQQIADLDHFDRVQLEEVIAVCRESRSLSEAGRVLFDASRTRRKVTNDADRLRKYLSKFGLDWRDVVGHEDATL